MPSMETDTVIVGMFPIAQRIAPWSGGHCRTFAMFREILNETMQGTGRPP